MLRTALGAVLTALLLTLGGCGLWGGHSYEAGASPKLTQYRGLPRQRVVLLVYCDDATTFLYPQARQEVSSFVAAELAKKLPKAQLVNYHTVIDYQNNTPAWDALPVKAIGKHFSADRVIYIELIAYSFH